MKLSDILMLAKAGYKFSEVKELISMAESGIGAGTGTGTETETETGTVTEIETGTVTEIETGTVTETVTETGTENSPTLDSNGGDDYKKKYEDALKALKAAQAANVNRNVVKNGKTTEELLEEMFVEFM